jgi:hypothetical protein
MRLQSDYALEIVTIDIDDGPVHWLAMWWQGDDRKNTTPIWTSPTAYPSILDAYRSAAKWAMLHAPMELCAAVIQLKD